MRAIGVHLLGFWGLVAALVVACSEPLWAQSVREVKLLDAEWEFALGDASSPAADFGCGTAYFNYLTKAASIHNEGPYSPKFDPKKWGKEWKTVDLPHDWVVDLPFAPEASHSHGYKCVGHTYPENSVGWYRKVIHISEEELGNHFWLQFDAIFRDARVWFNGFYLGSEPSGYATQLYDITEYINYGGENLITVRADATLEEGWFYEGAGIYRHVWLHKTHPLHVAPFGTFVRSALNDDFTRAELTIETSVRNAGLQGESYTLRHKLQSREGEVVACAELSAEEVAAKLTRHSVVTVEVEQPHLWSLDDTYRYRLHTELLVDGRVVDHYITPVGIRRMEFCPERGFLLNGEQIKLRGVNMHQDHAGVGSAIPDALQYYRLRRLKSLGCNAYRSSHNPMTPEMLEACDSLGFVVIEENRLMGINHEHERLLRRMIERDRNHPSIALWSVGNEEWGLEWSPAGERVVASMREMCHRLDPSRPVTAASSGGPTVLVPTDVAGYNYLLQNPIDRYREEYPERSAVGSEETTGCGTRGCYFDDRAEGRMAAHNRRPTGPDSLYNAIERGWKFYAEREWLGGLFYWTGFDYRGEPNPLKFPATGSQFGLLDYCGFEKDEAYYLKSWWTSEPTLHIFPHWNLQGHEGESVEVWAYSNCDEVELWLNGRSLGRKSMPENGHLSWQTTYQPGRLKAVGYKSGRKVLTQLVETTGQAVEIRLQSDRVALHADGADVAVVEVALYDKRGSFVPDDCSLLQLRVEGPIRILGVGNGDPAFRDRERPSERDASDFEVRAFHGRAQLLLQSRGEQGVARLTVSGEGLAEASFELLVE